MQSFNGPETATLRMKSLTGEVATIFIEEEASVPAIAEGEHDLEDVGYMALYDNPFVEVYVAPEVTVDPLPGVPEEPAAVPWGTGDATLEMGTVTGLDHNPQTVNLGNTYNNPVVIMGVLSYNGADPSTVRVKDVTPNSFTV
jgi:hypothetical protein